MSKKKVHRKCYIYEIRTVQDHFYFSTHEQNIQTYMFNHLQNVIRPCLGAKNETKLSAEV